MRPHALSSNLPILSFFYSILPFSVFILIIFVCFSLIVWLLSHRRVRGGGAWLGGALLQVIPANRTADHSRRTWVQPITALLPIIPANRTADHSRRTWVQPITAFLWYFRLKNI